MKKLQKMESRVMGYGKYSEKKRQSEANFTTAGSEASPGFIDHEKVIRNILDDVQEKPSPAKGYRKSEAIPRDKVNSF